MHYTVLDSETTGLGSVVRACEIAWIVVDESLTVLDEQVHRTDPQHPIDPGAEAIHGISNAAVAGLPDNATVCAMIPKSLTWIGHNCLTGDHEVLTREGWKRLDELVSVSAEAAVWDFKNNSITFETASLVVKDYEGVMLKYNTLYHCGIYTPEHRVYYTKTAKLLGGGTPVWQVVTAADYSKFGANSVAIPSAGYYSPVECLGISPEEARFIEMVRADGSIEITGSMRLKFSKARKVDRCKSLLDSLKLPYTVSEREAENYQSEKTTRFSILDCELRTKAIGLLGVGKAKQLGAWVLNLSLEARLALLDEAAYWDGDFASDKVNNVQTQVTSSKSSEIEWFQIAAVTSGLNSKVYLAVPNTSGFSREDGKLSKVTIRTRNYVKTLKIPETIDYVGKVYCLSTTTGAFLVRRNSCVWITGNCSYDQRVLGDHLTWSADLCTLALARRWVKNTTNHKLATLQQELKLSEQQSHSALGDCRTTLELLRLITGLSGRTLPELVELEGVPKMLNKMCFGMYKGKTFAEIPKNYRLWMMEQKDWPKDIAYTLERLKLV